MEAPTIDAFSARTTAAPLALGARCAAAAAAVGLAAAVVAAATCCEPTSPPAPSPTTAPCPVVSSAPSSSCCSASSSSSTTAEPSARTRASICDFACRGWWRYCVLTFAFFACLSTAVASITRICAGHTAVGAVRTGVAPRVQKAGAPMGRLCGVAPTARACGRGTQTCARTRQQAASSGLPVSYLLDYLARAASLLPLCIAVCTQCARSVHAAG